MASVFSSLIHISLFLLSRNVAIAKDGQPSHEISIIIKFTFESHFMKRFSAINRIFARELFWFKKILPALTKLCPGFDPLYLYVRFAIYWIADDSNNSSYSGPASGPIDSAQKIGPEISLISLISTALR